MPTRGGSEDRRPGPGGKAITDEDGRFEIRHLRPHRHTMFWAPEGYDVRVGQRVRAGTSGLVLTSRRRPRVTGRVLADDGSPLRRFTIDAETFSADDGRFAKTISAAGRARLRVEADGFAPLEKDLDLHDRRDLDLGDLRLSRGRTVRVSVLAEASSQPVRAAQVAAGLAGERPWSLDALARGRTDRDGAATLAGLPATALDVLVSADGLAPALVPLPSGATELTVRLREGGRIEGTVRNAAGEPIENAPVAADGGAFDRASLTDAQGRFAIDGLPAGEYTVAPQGSAAEEDDGLAPRVVRVVGSRAVRVDFQERGATPSAPTPAAQETARAER